jgi:hypothetical protein
MSEKITNKLGEIIAVKNYFQGWGYRSVVEQLPSMYEEL